MIFAGAALALAAPVIAAAALSIAAFDGFPVLFRQVRMGVRGRRFEILKLRTMRAANTGARITAGGDARITRVGRVLRAYKLDELPQLWNVLRGEMSMIGPRPEVPAFVDWGDARWRAVLSVRPGLTDLATLLYRGEEAMLAGAADPERMYRDAILPAKLEWNLAYLRSRCFASDLRLIWWTARSVVSRAGVDARNAGKIFPKERAS